MLTMNVANAQITVTVGSALLQDPGTDILIPVSVKGLNSATGGIPVTGIELHIKYTNNVLVYDTTLDFNALVPAPQWYFGASEVEYGANWVEPGLNKLNIPDNTILFNISFHYLGSNTELIFDTTTSILIDSAFGIIPGVQYVNGVITPSQGSGESRWNGTGPWNTIANWSNGIPGDSTDAVIETGAVTILSNAVCKSMTIKPGNTVNVSPGFSLSVNRNYINNGTFNLLSDITGSGSVIVIGQVSGTGENNLEKYLDLKPGFSHNFSAPSAGVTAAVFGGNVSEKYIESDNSWQVLSSSSTLENGHGYRVNGSTPSTVVCTGIFNTQGMTVTNLGYTAAVSDETRGLNLLGNPFPSAIQWEQGNWMRTNIDYAVYIWEGYKYVSWNGTTGSLKNGIIPAMQGFLVKANATGGALTIPAGARLHSTQPYYKESDALTDLISLKLENVMDTAYFDETFVQVVSGSSSGFDGTSDALKLFGNDAYPQIYTVAADQKALSINTQPDYTAAQIDFKVGTTGSYKISFSNIETFNPNQPLYFEDKKTGGIINIRNSREFVFSTDLLAEPGRFVLHFNEVGMQDLSQGSFAAWCSGNICHLDSEAGPTEIEQVELFNTMGKLVFKTSKLVTPATFTLNDGLQGLHILRIKTREGSFVTKLMVRIP